MYEESGILPKALVDRPVLGQRWVFAKQVFDDLSSQRHTSMNGVGAIMLSEYTIYALGHRFTRQEWEDVWEDLSIIDSIWRAKISEKTQ